MNDFIILMLTSEGCGHCAMSRGNGLLNNGKQYTDSKFMKKTLQYKNSSVPFFNIHYQDMSGKKERILNVSKIFIENNIVVQEIFYNDNGKMKMLIYDEFGNKKSKDITLGGNSIPWVKFLMDKIPSQIINYVFYFPAFLIIKKEDWKKSILSEKFPLYALPNAGNINRKEDGSFVLEKNPQTLNSSTRNIEKIILDYFEGKETFILNKDLKDPKKTENNNNNRDTDDNNSNFFIKNYEDSFY